MHKQGPGQDAPDDWHANGGCHRRKLHLKALSPTDFRAGRAAVPSQRVRVRVRLRLRCRFDWRFWAPVLAGYPNVVSLPTRA